MLHKGVASRGLLSVWKLGIITASSLAFPLRISRTARTHVQRFSTQTAYGADHCEETEYAFHVKAPFAGPCVDVISSATGLSIAETQNLLKIGAVYHKASESPKAFRILSNTIVQPGEYLRIHHKPRMFSVSDIDWKSSVVAETEHYIICHKPAGIPTHANVDNLHENAVNLLKIALNLPELHPPHRLDTDTSGVIVFGKTKVFSTWFSRQMAARNVRKAYKALVCRAISNNNHSNISNLAFPELNQVITSHLVASKAVPKVYLTNPGDNTHEARLILKNRTQVYQKPAHEWTDFLSDKLIPGSRISKALHEWVSDKPAGYELGFAEVDIELLTGRTHQIRGQLQLEGWHVAGDNMYKGVSSRLQPDIYQSSPYLALQAHYIEFSKFCETSHSAVSQEVVSYTAPPPWWHPLLKEE